MQPAPPRLQHLQQVVGTISGGLATAGCIRLGIRLGLYEAMAGKGPMTAAGVAAAAGLNERFVLEWLRQQAVAGILVYQDGTFEVDEAARTLFVDETSPAFAAGPFQTLSALIGLYESAEGAFRTGLGRPFSDLGQERIKQMPRMPLQVWARNALIPQALSRIPGLIDRLEQGATVCDVGCGAGAAPMAIATAFPASRVTGYDTWDDVLHFAAEQSASAGLGNLTFLNPERDPLPSEPTFDLVLTMDVLHDMTRPDIVAAEIRRAMKPNGFWFIVDFNCSDDFAAEMARPTAAASYGWSLTICLQSSASTPDGLALGNAGLPEPKMRDLVLGAGFSSLERVEGISHPMNSYYVARP